MNSHIDFRAAAEELLAAHPASNVYFLLDHGGLPGLRRQLSKSSAEWSSLFDCTHETSALEVAPLLVLAGSEGRPCMSRALFDWIGEHGTYSSSVIMLASPLDMATLRARLAARLDARLSENMAAMLRFFDPRVLESLLKILPGEQLNVFTSPAQCWCYVDRTGKQVRVATAFDAREHFSSPLVLGEQEEFALLQACELDQVLDLLRRNMPELMATLPLPAQATFVERSIATARSHRIDSVFKFSLYTAVSLLRGEAFVDGPQGARFLDELKQDDSDVLERLETFDLDEIRRES